MLEFLREFRDVTFDAIWFLPGNKLGTVTIESNRYKNPGEKLSGSDYGDAYHVILFREDDGGDLCHIDRFEGILGEPLEYISGLIKQDWFGMIAKKTTTSTEFVDKLFDKLCEP
jgi:hypothetical protein